eukprot:TRINITY_DN10255_c0_g1_i1.p1 TRINITY_DN10255_c0_g1~~TRINITY_DN10255_c0_g1_i1.p1  ORF type:complete len:386 (-),score=93.79 TRINITY_DN10255_c0_g1_i1:210-1367(-)
MKVRMMLPMSIRCNTCGEYLYKGKKFNARKETVEGEDYLGIKIFRFYLKCTRCSAEFTVKTDPKNSDYICEMGASRNFEPWREQQKEFEKAQEDRKKEEEGDAMKALENRTMDSKEEMDILDALDEIRSLNARANTVNLETVLQTQKRIRLEREQQLDEEDRKLVESIKFGIVQDSEDEEEEDDDDVSANFLPMHGSMTKENPEIEEKGKVLVKKKPQLRMISIPDEEEEDETEEKEQRGREQNARGSEQKPRSTELNRSTAQDQQQRQQKTEQHGQQAEGQRGQKQGEKTEILSKKDATDSKAGVAKTDNGTKSTITGATPKLVPQFKPKLTPQFKPKLIPKPISSAAPSTSPSSSPSPSPTPNGGSKLTNENPLSSLVSDYSD